MAGARRAALADLVDAADLVLVDAPCSGTGTWRRNPGGALAADPGAARAAGRRCRRGCSTSAAALVKPGGALVYIVCSLLDEEGPEQVVAFLAAPSRLGGATRSPCRGRAAWTGTSPHPGARRHRRLFRRSACAAVLDCVRYSLFGEADAFPARCRCCLRCGLLAVSSGSFGQKPDDQIDPRSLRFQKQGEPALAAGNHAAAERRAGDGAWRPIRATAAAFIALGHVAQAQALPGKAIRYYKDALLLEPNDVGALAGEGDALVQRGAVDRAKDNLARIKTLCKSGLPRRDDARRRDRQGPAAAVQTAQASDKVPPKGQEDQTPTTGKN